MNTSPRFITLEGGDGSGKTTQIKLLSQALDEKGIDHIVTREPGGCDSAMDIRKLLLTGDPNRWDGLSELLLYNAARNEHLRKTIRPALRDGKWVICDRFADSTLVYQSIARGIPMDVVDYVTMLVVQGTRPDMTLLLDIDAELGLERTEGPRLGLEENRLEQEPVDFHKKIRQGFLNLAKDNAERYRVVDANQSIENVHRDIIQIMNEFWIQGNVA